MSIIESKKQMVEKSFSVFNIRYRYRLAKCARTLQTNAILLGIRLHTIIGCELLF